MIFDKNNKVIVRTKRYVGSPREKADQLLEIDRGALEKAMQKISELEENVARLKVKTEELVNEIYYMKEGGIYGKGND